MRIRLPPPAARGSASAARPAAQSRGLAPLHPAAAAAAGGAACGSRDGSGQSSRGGGSQGKRQQQRVQRQAARGRALVSNSGRPDAASLQRTAVLWAGTLLQGPAAPPTPARTFGEARSSGSLAPRCSSRRCSSSCCCFTREPCTLGTTSPAPAGEGARTCGKGQGYWSSDGVDGGLQAGQRIEGHAWRRLVRAPGLGRR